MAARPRPSPKQMANTRWMFTPIIPAVVGSWADARIALPPKHETYNTIEGMISHFKVIMDGIHVPAGEVYSFTEGGNGELGFYLVSDGTGRPIRCRVRPPCFANTAILSKTLPGLFIADVVPTFGMINMIGGECDR